MKNVKIGGFVFFDNTEISIIHDLAAMVKKEKRPQAAVCVHRGNWTDLVSWPHLCNKLRELSRFDLVSELDQDTQMAKKMRALGVRSLIFCINREKILKLSHLLEGTGFVGNDSVERAMIEICSYMLSSRTHLLRMIDAKAMSRTTKLSVGYSEHMGLLRPVIISDKPGRYLELTKNGVIVASSWVEVSKFLQENDKFANMQ